MPHCRLSFVKALIEAGKVRATRIALTGSTALGFDFDGIVEVVMALNSKDFCKNMTTHVDYKVWQDVYRTSTEAGEVYLKLTVIDDVLIVSFKEAQP
ncbi:type II toxin-antitoxin system MqsR family toxin [Pseudomonas sp. 3A(2025)]